MGSIAMDSVSSVTLDRWLSPSATKHLLKTLARSRNETTVVDQGLGYDVGNANIVLGCFFHDRFAFSGGDVLPRCIFVSNGFDD